MHVAVITTVRNDRLFLRKWIDYYGANFGRQSLFVIIDGLDQPIPDDSEGVNFLVLPHRDWDKEVKSVPLRRVVMEHHRSRAISSLAASLYRYVNAVIATDVDEFLVPDPAKWPNLRDYVLANAGRHRTLSGVGLDVIQHLGREGEIDPAQPFLAQRSVAVVSNAYTKPVLSYKPVTWGAGLHRIKGRNYHVAPDLFLFHLGMVDYTAAMGRANDPNLIKSGWGPHLLRREAMYRHVESATVVDGDSYFPQARARLTWRRRLLAWNKPAPLPGPPVVTIPDRFRSLL